MTHAGIAIIQIH